MLRTKFPPRTLESVLKAVQDVIMKIKQIIHKGTNQYEELAASWRKSIRKSGLFFLYSYYKVENVGKCVNTSHNHILQDIGLIEKQAIEVCHHLLE